MEKGRNISPVMRRVYELQDRRDRSALYNILTDTGSSRRVRQYVGIALFNDAVDAADADHVVLVLRADRTLLGDDSILQRFAANVFREIGINYDASTHLTSPEIRPRLLERRDQERERMKTRRVRRGMFSLRSEGETEEI